MIICTTDKWGRNALDACENQQPPVTKLRFQDLDDSAIDWSDFKNNRPQEIKFKAKKKLRPQFSLPRAMLIGNLCALR